MDKVGNAEQLKIVHEATKSTVGYKRITSLFDSGSFNGIDCYAKSGENFTGAVAGYGTIEGCPVYAFAQSSDIEGGAMMYVLFLLSLINQRAGDTRSRRLR